LHIEIIRVT